MNPSPALPCPNDETLAAWVEGRLPQDEAAALIEHASNCGHCISMIDAANETFHVEVTGAPVATQRGRQRWLLAAAA
ncbi:MAG TPA: zf-HC2 domain-containing protein, partial [Vicinamibacterales bacterium]